MKKAILIVLTFLSVLSIAQVDEAEIKVEQGNLEKEPETFELVYVGEKAEFKGGEEKLFAFIAENVEYPKLAVEDSVSGTVIIQFTIDTIGRVENITAISRKIGFGLEEEAMRVVKSTSGMWIPAKQRGEPVKVRYRLPVKFILY